MPAWKIPAGGSQCIRMKTPRFCAASKVSLEPRKQTHAHSRHNSRHQADLMLLGGADWLGLNVAPAELPAQSESPSNMKNRDQPATGAGGDYKAFVAARKWREILLQGYFLQQLVENASPMNLWAGS